MKGSRAKSSSRASSSRGKPFFQRKFKERTGNSGIFNETNLSMDQSKVSHSKFFKSKDLSKVFLQRTFRNRFPVDESFPDTSRKLEGTNFSHHDPELCVC